MILIVVLCVLGVCFSPCVGQVDGIPSNNNKEPDPTTFTLTSSVPGAENVSLTIDGVTGAYDIKIGHVVWFESGPTLLHSSFVFLSFFCVVCIVFVFIFFFLFFSFLFFFFLSKLTKSPTQETAGTTSETTNQTGNFQLGDSEMKGGLTLPSPLSPSPILHFYLEPTPSLVPIRRSFSTLNPLLPLFWVVLVVVVVVGVGVGVGVVGAKKNQG